MQAACPLLASSPPFVPVMAKREQRRMTSRTVASAASGAKQAVPVTPHLPLPAAAAGASEPQTNVVTMGIVMGFQVGACKRLPVTAGSATSTCI